MPPKKSDNAESAEKKALMSEPRLLKNAKASSAPGGNQSKLSSVAISTKTSKNSTLTAKTQKSSAGSYKSSSIGGASAAKSSMEDALDKEMSRILTIHQWYHGVMPREEIEEMVKTEGEFIVRKTEMQGESRYAISVMHSGRLRHILLNYKPKTSMWAIRDVKKNSLTALIEHFVSTKDCVQSDGSRLLIPVPRPDYYILHDHIDVGDRLGGGAFGEVHMGKLRRSNGEVVEVAIKTLKGVMHKKQKADFVKEARLNRKFDHPNIVRLYGIAPQCEPLMIVLELAPAGSLKCHLMKYPQLAIEILNNYVKDACRGMCYLAGRRVIHRDIAARNCLLGKNMEVKIGDFGLSVANKEVLKLEKLKNMPVKWLAPETLKKGEFSTKSDVWSLGVLIWEIYSRCKTDPFPGESNVEAKAKILSGNDPMVPPPNTPTVTGSVMKLCFTQDPEERPDFESLLKLLSPKEMPPPVLPFGVDL